MGTAQDIFDAVESHALASGLFDRVNTSEPTAAPGSNLSCGIWVEHVGPAGSGLAATSAPPALSARPYTAMFAAPLDLIDPNLTAACFTMMEAYTGDFGLSVVSSVRAVDLLGHYGTGLESRAGYLNMDGKMFRVLTISLPIICNDLWTQTE